MVQDYKLGFLQKVLCLYNGDFIKDIFIEALTSEKYIQSLSVIKS